MKGLDFFPPKAQEKAITEYLDALDEPGKVTVLAGGNVKCRMLNKRRSAGSQRAYLLYPRRNHL